VVGWVLLVLSLVAGGTAVLLGRRSSKQSPQAAAG
jgi:hypothetical protein